MMDETPVMSSAQSSEDEHSDESAKHLQSYHNLA